MSCTYNTSTLTIDHAVVQGVFSSPSELAALHNTAQLRIVKKPGEPLYNSAIRPKEEITFVNGSTRNGWAVFVMADLLSTLPFPSLRFLTDDGHHQEFDDDDLILKVTVLHGAEQQQAITQMRQLLADLAANPALLTAAAGEICSDEESSEALARDYVSATPWADTNVSNGGDDGDNEDYLCVYLRSILAVLENADRQALATVHILDHPA